MATKKLVPRETNEGGLGTALKVWGGSWLQNLVITNLQTSVSGSVLVETAGNVEKRAATSFLPNLESLDEGVSLTTTTESINYVGPGVTTTVSGNDTTVTIPGASPVADTNDSTSYVGLWESATGVLLPKTDEELRYDATDDTLKIGKSGMDLWIKSGYITQYAKHLKVKVKGGIDIISSYGKVRIFGGITPLASFYSMYGTWIHLLQTELTPEHIITEAVPGGSSTNVPSGVKGILCRTPIANLVPNLQSLDEGSSLTATTQSINYVGAGVTTTVGSSNDTTVTIPGVPAVLDTENPACFLGMYEAATGNLSPKTDEGLTYNALTGSEVLTLVGDMDITGNGTTSNILDIINTTLTTGIALNVSVSGEKTGTNSNPLVNFDLDETVPDTITNGMPVLKVDYRKTGSTGSGVTSKKYGARMQVWDASTNNAGASVEQTALYLQSGFNVNAGSIKQTGLFMEVGASGVGDSGLNTVGIDMAVLDTGYDIYMRSHSTNGWATMRTVAHGAFELTTIDPLSDNADITLTADGETIFQKNSTGSTVVQATVESLRTESFMMACSDETTALTQGNGKVTFRMPYAFTITDIRASLTTAGTGANLVTVNVNNGGTSILTNKVTLDATEKTSTTATTAFSFTSAAAALLADDAEISIDIDQIDSGGVSAGLKVAIIGYKTV